MSKPIVALMYDFDRTLASEDMQNFSFIPNLNLTPKEFWTITEEFCKKNNIDKILGYMYVMISECKKRNIPLTREYLEQCGKKIKFYDGVTTWFKRINKYGNEHGLKIEHYLITSGNKEMVQGCAIANEFKAVFGCEFLFDDKTKEAYWPKTSINYTQKTQYVFRISKGLVDTNSDDEKLNSKTRVRRVKYDNMIYIGDGLTDVPAMIVVKENNGHSIAVYPKGMSNKVSSLYSDGRVNYISKADYSVDGQLEKEVKLIIDLIAAQERLDYKKEKIEKAL